MFFGCYDTRRLRLLPAWLRRCAGFAAFVARRWREDRCPQVAGSLTFTSLLALVPLFTVVVAVLSATPVFEPVMVQFKVFLLLNLVPEIAGRIITVYMLQFAESAAGLTTVSLAALFAMAVAMLLTVDRALNAIWRVRRKRPLWVSMTVYSALLVAGPLLLGLSLAATTWAVSASLGRVELPTPLQSLVMLVVPVSASATALFLLYRVFPNQGVPARHALAGAIAAAVVFEATKSLFAAWIGAVPTYQLVYGAFAAIPIFLAWLYLAWLVVLAGAEFTAALAHGAQRREAPVTPAEAEAAQAIEAALAPRGGRAAS